MRSLLFVPGDSPRKLARGLQSGADALILDLEDSVAADRKAEARATALAFLKDIGTTDKRPRLLVRVNGLDTGLTDADLDAVVAGRPDAILLPKAEGGPSVIHLDAKLAAREALAGLPDGAIGIMAIATETAAALFAAGTYAGASPRLSALTWGAEDLSADIGATRTAASPARFAWRAACASPPRQPPRWRRSTRCSSISATPTACGAKPKRHAATASSASLRFTPGRSP
jgi:citrate lyase subunit beta/citryl-CoA lyase